MTNEVVDRLKQSDEQIEQLIEIGMYERVEPCQEVMEMLRVYWKADQFRQVGERINRIDYQTMVGVYDDYECSLDYSVFIEMFPYFDGRYTVAANEAVASRAGKKGGK